MSHSTLLLDLPVPLQTPRLLLRPPHPGDGAALHEGVAESRTELRRFLGSLPWVAEDLSHEAAEAFCRNAHANFLLRNDLSFFVFEKATGRFVGQCGLHRTDWTVPRTEVGYWVRTSMSGRGYVAEAVQALAGLAFDVLGVARIELVTDEDNEKSRRVADRCGFRLEGILRNHRRASDGSLRNMCVYARLAEHG